MKKIIIDILMFIALILEFSKAYLSPLIHELLGVSITILFITHLILNRQYIKTIFKGKYNFNRILLLIINIILFVSMLTTIVSGLIISQVLLKGISKYNMDISKLHIIVSFVSILLIGLHLGFKLNLVVKKIPLFRHKILLAIINIILLIVGCYSIYKIRFFSYLFGINTFFSKDLNLLTNATMYATITISFSIVMYYINNMLLKAKKPGKNKNSNK